MRGLLILLVACTSAASGEPLEIAEDSHTVGGTRDEASDFDEAAMESSQTVAAEEPARPPTTEADAAPEAEPVEEPARRPTTILAPSRPGRISADAVRRVIREHQPEVSACYEEGLSRDRNLRGQADVRFLVGPRGQVEDAEVFSSTLGDRTVEDCIIGAMRRWEFPRPRPRGRSVLLTYPYILSTE